ncbi:hypothetical protein ACHAXR_013052 [Thalassiosira sp. AJA248-18]
MHCYALAAFLSLVTVTAALKSIPPFHRAVPTRVSNYAHHSIHRQSFHRNRQELTKILVSASSGDDDDTGMTEQHKDAVTGVTLKMAFDSSPAWGVADLSETKSERFTSPESLDMVHRLRRESSAVLVGRGTVKFDDCSLSVRRVELGEGKVQPTRVILDPSLSLVGGDYTILKDGLPTIIYHLQTEDMNENERLNAANDSVTIVGLSPSNQAGRFSIPPSGVVQDLADRGLQHIMVEGGPATARAFLDARVVDRAILVRAPIEFEIPVPAQMDDNTLKSAGLQMIGNTVMGGDNVEYWTRDGMPWPNSDLPMWP